MGRPYYGMCIGGPASGSWRAVEAPHYKVTEHPRHLALEMPGKAKAEAIMEITEHLYAHKELHFDDGGPPIGVWLHADMTMREAVMFLFRTFERQQNHA